MSDVIAHGANAAALAAATPDRKQEQALSGFGNACSCETVAPLSTTTITNTIFPDQTITTTESVAPGSNQTAVRIESAESGALPSGAAASNGAGTVAVPAIITSPASISVVASGSILPVAPPSASGGTSAPVVVGIPFECPTSGTNTDEANGLSPQFIIGDLRYEYSVLCDTAVTGSNTLAGIQNVANQTACAAHCSLVNSRSQRQLCQSASFVPNSGASDGQCFLHGSAQNFARSPGSVTILLTQVSSKSDNCKSVDLVNGPSNTTVDTAQLVGDVLTEGFSLSTPGLITRSATGGVFKTFWSSGYTDSVGAYHYSWFEVYASSSAWWAAYATSWTCTVKNTPRTVVIAQPVPNLTSVFIDVTTIVENGTTTIISGTSTFSRTGGEGVIFPTSVAALGTGGNGIFTIAGATETSNATAGAGVSEIPAPTSAPGVANETAIIPAGTGSQGAATIIVSGSAATFSSVEGGGIISGSPVPQPNSTAGLSAGSAAFIASGAASIANATAGSGDQPGVAQSSGGLAFSIAGAISTEISTGGFGVIFPSPSNGNAIGTGSIAVPSSNASAEGVQSPARTSTSAFVLPPQHGYDYTPPSSAVASLPSSSAAVSGSSGGGQFSEFGETATLNIAGFETVIPPPPIGTGTSSGAPINTLNGTVVIGAPTAGSVEVTLVGSTAVILSTGGAGSLGPIPVTVNGTELPPSLAPSGSLPTGTAPTNDFSNADSPRRGSISRPTAPANSTAFLPTGTAPASEAPIFNATVSVSEGVAVLSVSGAASVLLSTGASNVIPPVSANISIPTPTEFVSETASGFAPSPSSNSTAAEEGEEGGGPFGILQFSEEATEGPSESGEVVPTGAIPLPSSNVTLPASVSATPSPSSNGSLPVGTAVFITSGGVSLSSVASGGGVVLPSLNFSVAVIPSSSANVSVIPLGTAPASGAQNILTSGATAIILSTGTGGVVLPMPTNQTASAPASQPASPSTTNIEDEFNNSFGDRTGGLRRSSTRGTASLGTAPLVTAPIVTGSSAPASNSTMPPPPPPYIPNGGYGVESVEVVSVAQPSVTMAPVSANSSAVFPTASGSAEQPAVVIPALTANLTLLLPMASGSTEQPSVVIPPLSVNLTVALPTASGSVEQPSAELPPIPANRTATSSGGAEQAFIFTEQPSVTLPPLSANSSAVFPTASGSTGPEFSNSGDDRLGRPRSRTTTGPSEQPLATGNLTLSGTAPIPTANASLLGTAPLSAVPVPLTTGVGLNSTQLPGATGSSVVPVQSANSPFGSLAVPVVSANFSLLATGSSAVPIQSANSTAFLPTGTAPPANSTTAPGPEFSNTENPRRGSFSRSSAPANSTGLLPTGTAPAINTVALNSSAPIGTASAPVPLFTAASVSIAVISENVTVPLGTGVVSASPLPSANVTVPLSIGVAFNETTPFATGTGASITPSASLNGTEGCPTPTPTVIPHTIVVTTVSYETLLVGPSTCAPTASAGLLEAGLLQLNATLPTGTGTAAVSAASPVITSHPYRRTGEVATQEQIDQSCADHDNIVINPDFSPEAANTVFGWTTNADDPSVNFRTQNSTDGQFARVLAAATNTALTISQPLTLCPGKEYKLISTNRVGNLMSKCQADYYIGDDFVYQASPQETFTKRQEFFTAGSSPADVSQDLRVVVKCNGEAGMTAGTDADGYMNLDIDDVGVQLV
ncbi:uncharacterized protein N0V89_008301 [Didymosphaeria variabile]|uniref:Apple domain-containing protein n=1 Tax=Didymosphaeria variabile TaxID=1932322 RepID=A0A9W9C8F4_9PLEO|nr:uncharacterized protein N0V89_008301 [Didymosphaeria variabile]KAJ4349684.1 hypothetical protein N0V89_008301 [Didymosphaeria variabile]